MKPGIARQTLLALREDLRRKIRDVMPLELEELDNIDIALSAIGRVPCDFVAPGEFSGRPVIEAARIVLDRASRSMTLEELTAAIVISGAGKSDASRPHEWRVAQSVSFHVARKNLTSEQGRIGLPL